jgi:hypothetical protein
MLGQYSPCALESFEIQWQFYPSGWTYCSISISGMAEDTGDNWHRFEGASHHWMEDDGWKWADTLFSHDACLFNASSFILHSVL